MCGIVVVERDNCGQNGELAGEQVEENGDCDLEVEEMWVDSTITDVMPKNYPMCSTGSSWR